MPAIEDMSRTTGARFFVDSTADGASDAAGYGQTPDEPFATIDFAVGKCTASRGDIIYVGPGHAENLVGATSLVVDVAGVSIIGLGSGALRPRLTYTTAAAATISVTAANCRLENLWLVSAFTNGVTIGISAGALADGLVLKDIVMQESLATQEFLIGVNIAAACHDVTIDGFQFHGVVGGTDSSCIVFAGASDRHVVRNAFMHGDWSGAVLESDTAASLSILYENITYYQDDAAAGLGVDTSDTSTGLMINCQGLAKKEGVEGFTGNIMAYSQCYCTNVVNKQGFLLPVADA
tara:strand:+ start:4010 stop:4888 length:879 start_codon:yes stop_codon:yes gene_type:complete